MNISAPVLSAINGVSFGFLSSEEIKALSVKCIYSASTFDTLLHPVPGGLYDPALGAFLDNPCTTCNLSRFSCPGHCGHVQLPAPVYHPSFMDQCLRLLRAKCIYCHKLKMPRAEVHRFMCKLRLVRHGLLKEAEEIEQLQPKAKKARLEAGEEDLEADSDEEADGYDIIQQREKFVTKAIRTALQDREQGEPLTEKNEAIAAERKYIIKEFLTDITKTRRCSTCKGITPGYRKDRYVKIFRKLHNEKERNAMIQLGLSYKSPSVILNERKKAANKEKPNGVVDEGVADMDSSVSEEEDVEMVDADVDEGLITSEATMTASNSKTKKPDAKGIYMSAGEVHAALTLLFEKEQDILTLVYGSRGRRKGQAALNADMFFIHTVLIPPNKYRPEGKGSDDSITESQDNSLYKKILQDCDSIVQINREIHGQAQPLIPGGRARGFDELQNAWVTLQDSVNSLIDSDRNPVQGAAGKMNADGIKQKLEKKEGLFRKNMMGKRVNFAARSVISPDPNIETNEIGVPPVFAKKLTYPEPVTNHNFYELKEAVMNGPDRWPGATAIENENGQIINLRTKSDDERLALANQLLAPSNTRVNGARNKKVHRHLNNGDIVIMNRQPTLHKPSMMAHRARVLPGEKTIRMHYANCNTYNADFDGDEMNMHFPQNEVARAEALTIADTDHQYLSATAGAPLRGLIQDHLSMGVQMCSRDVFYTRDEYHQLLYACLRPEENHTTTSRIQTVPPAIMLPKQLWTGKQLITTVLKNITPENYVGITISSKTQTSASNWGPGSEEGMVIVKDGELLTGVLDKRQIGSKAGGLVHAVYEAYGHTVAGRLLSILGRLLTKVLHIRAFSCGVEDLVLTPEGDARRQDHLKKVDDIGLEVASMTVSLEDVKDSNDPELRRRLEEVLRDDTKQEALDARMKGAGSALSSDIVKDCLPSGLIKPFPKNHMQAMTESGAKGSDVNAKLISCNLGQQVLEGRRVPTMVSGKTLPCFKPFESSIRAGGFIADRFLTGIRPQEYYFHAMAGREGLIDTAVKTSRSGYLQRCLIKGMEGLKVEYDTSVRDSDGSMVQFLYGEDGLDVTKTGYLTNFKFLAQNFWSIYNGLGVKDEFSSIQSDEASEWNKTAIKKVKKTGDLAAMDPAISVFSPSRMAGSTSEKFHKAVKKYVDDNPDKLILDKKKGVVEGDNLLKRKAFQTVLDIKYLKSVIEAGEAVGVVAGQSIGEPSTQMTLNTFHLAGHSAKNVTLGIPRLREIVMTASAKIATPTMTLHLIPEILPEHGEQFAKAISRLSLAEVLDNVTVTEKVGRGKIFTQAKVYEVQLNFFSSKDYRKEYAITIADVVRTIERKLLPLLTKSVRKALKAKGEEKAGKTASKIDSMPDIGKSVGTVKDVPSRGEEVDDGEESEADSDTDDDDGDGDATNSKQKGKRKEVDSYEAPDEDEEQILEQNRREGTPDTDMDDEGYSGSPKPTQDNEDEEDEDEDERAIRKNLAGDRESRIKSNVDDVVSFKFDDRSGAWCNFSLEYSATTSKVLMLHLVETACRNALIQSIPGLGDCMTETIKERDDATGQNVDVPVISTQGQNLVAMREYQHIINPHKIFTNDIAAMLRLYGVEACRASIVREMSAVFDGHGIDVDNRHLNLIADVMTRGGGYAAFNRMGMAGNVSPFMKMSFETTVGFLRDAVLEKDVDSLKNPSARIVVGKLSTVGTGAFDVLCPVR